MINQLMKIRPRSIKLVSISNRRQLGTVVIGGGTGFIGNALSKQLKSQGYEIITISRKPGVSSITWNDLRSNGLPKRTEAVINLAGQNILDPFRRWTAGFKQNVIASRVNTTKYLANAILESETKPRVFVTTSGVAYYPPSASAEYDEESDGGDFDFLSRLCTDWEAAAQLPSEANVRVVTIRTGVVLGRHGGIVLQLFVPFFTGLGGKVGTGRQYMPWIHLNDIAALYAHAVDCDGLTGIVNGVAPNCVTNNEFTEAFGRAMWRPWVVPKPTIMINSMFGRERAKIMTEGQKVLPKKAIASGFSFQFSDIDSAAQEFSRIF